MPLLPVCIMSLTKWKNFSFSGCGFMLPYHFGVGHYLQTKSKLIHPKHSKFAGASGGSLMALILACEDQFSVLDMYKSISTVNTQCSTQGTINALESYLFDVLNTELKSIDVTKLNQRLTIATTRIRPTIGIVHTSTFTSRENLIETLLTSCFLPHYSANSFVRTLGKESHVDGGFLQLVPFIDDYTTVSAYPVYGIEQYKLRKYDISPLTVPMRHRLWTWQYLLYSIRPQVESINDRIFKHGYESAKAWHATLP